MRLSTAAPDTRPRQQTRERARLATHPASPFAATRRRLLLINLGVVTAILAVMAVSVYVAEAHAIDQQINQQLLDRARRDASSDALAVVIASPSVPGIEPRDSGEVAERYEPSSPNVFALVLDTNGQLLVDPGRVAAVGLPDHAAAREVLSGATGAVFSSFGQSSHEYRLYTIPLRSNDKIVGALQVGTSLDVRERQLHDLLLTLALVGAGVLVLTAGASLFLADRALVPTRLAFERQRQFAAAASHELRTPLAIARSQTELVLRRLRRGGTVDAQAAATDLEDVVAEVDYMTRLVRELLLLARDEHDQQGLVWAEVDLGALVSEVTRKLLPAAAERGLTLLAPSPDRPCIVRGDADRLRQCVLVLMENAIQYTPSGGTVEVTLRAESGSRVLRGHDGHVELRVRDTGAGISPEDAARIFEPFYRGQGGRRLGSEGEAHRGAGLGLALARWIVAAHGGDIMVEPGPGGGSVFTVVLPAIEE